MTGDAFERDMAERVRRRLRVLSIGISVVVLSTFLLVDPLLPSVSPLRWLRLGHVAVAAVHWVWLGRRRALRTVELATIFFWGVELALGSSILLWIPDEFLAQSFTGMMLATVAFLAVSQLSAPTAAWVLAQCWVVEVAAVMSRYPSGPPRHLWAMAGMLLPCVGAVAAIAAHRRLERAAFAAHQQRTEAALRAQCDAFLMELHDGVKATLSRAAILIASERADSAGSRLVEAERAVREALDESGTVLSLLEATPEQWDEFAAELRHDFTETCERVHLRSNFELSTDGSCARIGPDCAHALRRIAHQMLDNAITHAGAANTTCSLHATRGTIRLRLDDDGVGFGRHGIGRGLGIMQRRAARLGGTLAFGDRPNGGAFVEVAIKAVSQ